MGKVYASLTPELRSWLLQQKMFFVATAPLSADAHLNCSPKGADTFRVLGEKEVGYLDLTGSGIETVAHLEENRRILLMFCAFSGPPRIVRLHGAGTVFFPRNPEFKLLAQSFVDHPGARAIVKISINRISDSCGHGVPLMDFVSERNLLEKWSLAKGPDGLAEYRAAKNFRSIDGMPGYPPQS